MEVRMRVVHTKQNIWLVLNVSRKKGAIGSLMFPVDLPDQYLWTSPHVDFRVRTGSGT